MTFEEAITRNAFNSAVATEHSAVIGAQMLRDKVAADKQHNGRPGYVIGPCSVVKVDQSHGAKSAYRLAWEECLAKRNGEILACMTTEPMTIREIQKLTGHNRTPVAHSISHLLEDGLIGAVRRTDAATGFFRKG